MISFVAEIKPISVNRAYRVVKFGRRSGLAKTPEATAFQAHVRAGAMVALGRHVRPYLPKGVHASVRLQFHWPTEAGDIDGPVKQTLDALNGLLYADDRQVKRLLVERHKDSKRPRVEIEVCELGAEVIELPKFLTAWEQPPGIHAVRED